MKKSLVGLTMGLLLLLGACSDDASIQKELTEVLGANTLLVAEAEEFQTTNEGLLETSEELEVDYKALNGEYEELTEKLADLEEYEQKTIELEKEHKENIAAFKEEITELKGENKKYSDKIAAVAAAEQKEKEVAAAKQKEKEVAAAKQKEAAASKQQSQSASGTSTTSKSSTASASDKTSAPKTASKTVEVKGECNIKGSSSGIYHTPGSTYYNRTTNPAAMFCSVEEAKNAGYRAPKR